MPEGSALAARPAAGAQALRAAVIVATLALGLFADVLTDIAGQTAIGLAVFGVLFYVMRDVAGEERRALMLCLVIATCGEMTLSLGWGLYTYRLANIPLFVPPGHVLMLLLGISLARVMPPTAAYAVFGCAGGYALATAVMGVDTLGVALFAILAVSAFGMPAQRRLYASTFVLSLLLELYGTWLGNWSWAREVPSTALVTTNPPGVVGAFYCALDASVAAVSMLLARRWSARDATAIARGGSLPPN